jgi:hypothetical protein
MANFNLNKVILGGRMTADPELKQTPQGTSVTSFSVAVIARERMHKQISLTVLLGDKQQSLFADSSKRVALFAYPVQSKQDLGMINRTISAMQQK